MLSRLKAVREGFFELCIRVGEQALHALMEQDRTELYGAKWSRDPLRSAVRGGSTASEITLGGRRLRVRRLRAARCLHHSLLIRQLVSKQTASSASAARLRQIPWAGR